MLPAWGVVPSPEKVPAGFHGDARDDSRTVCISVTHD